MSEYLVIGLYADNDQRYATTVNADTPEDAERIAQDQVVQLHPEGLELIVAAVLLNGEVVA